MTREQRKQFVLDHRTAIFGYNRAKDGPAMSIVFYSIDQDEILVSTMAERAKAKAVARSPKVSLCVLDEQWPPSYLQVYCDAVIEHELLALLWRHAPGPPRLIAQQITATVLP